jgi:hypothetical protein
MLNWLHGPVTCEAQTGTCIVNIVIAAFVSSNAQAEMIDGQKRGLGRHVPFASSVSTLLVSGAFFFRMGIVQELTSEINHHCLQGRIIFKAVCLVCVTQISRLWLRESCLGSLPTRLRLHRPTRIRVSPSSKISVPSTLKQLTVVSLMLAQREMIK